MTLTSIIQTATKVVLAATPWLLLLLLFIWMAANIIWGSSNPEKRRQAGQRLLWAIIALFVIFSIGAIVAVLGQTIFGTSGFSNPYGSF